MSAVLSPLCIEVLDKFPTRAIPPGQFPPGQLPLKTVSSRVVPYRAFLTPKKKRYPDIFPPDDSH